MSNKSKLDRDQIGSKLLTPGFGGRNAPHAAIAPSDPIADTPMVVTLDQLRPYDKNPRINKNPKFDEIKESIRARGLDQIPGITRRPGEEFYIIRDGGNTRLQILNELWLETRDEKFFRLNVLFRPWDSEIRALTGHLAENDVRGGLSLIERALGIESARAQYEAADGAPLSQRELSRRLKADGYPISNSHISRMQDIIRYLLPAIPQVLYAGLGIDPAVKLIGLRKAAESVWKKHQTEAVNQSFDDVFVEALGAFNESVDQLNYQRVLDELTGQMSDALGVDYNLLSLDIQEEPTRARRLEATPELSTEFVAPEGAAVGAAAGEPGDAEQSSESGPGTTGDLNQPEQVGAQQPDATNEASTAPPGKTERVQRMKEQVAGAAGESNTPVTSPNPSSSIEGAGLSSPNIWDIATEIDDPATLRRSIAQLVREISIDAGLPDHVQELDGGVGFHYARPWTDQPQHLSDTALSTLMLFESLSGVYAVVQHSLQSGTEQAEGLLEFRFAAHLGQLLMGNPAEVSEGSPSSSGRLSDAAVIKLFRVIRLARRLIDFDRDFRQE